MRALNQQSILFSIFPVLAKSYFVNVINQQSNTLGEECDSTEAKQLAQNMCAGSFKL